ncbi:MAG: fatty acid desaturase, partial [Bacteroidota bacterium]
FKRKNRKTFVKRIIRGEFSFLLLCIALCFINWKATLLVFGLPFVVIRFAMMAGNWGQHAFIDASDPSNNYRNSITLINSLYNRRCFNDGYHIGHHLRPHMHWTDMPNDFIRNKDKYAENKAIVFEGMDFQTVWFWLMLKRYDVLADRFVNINNVYQSKEEIIAFLKERTRKIEPKSVPSSVMS